MTHSRAVQLAGLLNLASKHYERNETPFTRALNAERSRAGAMARLPWRVRALFVCARMVWTDVRTQRDADGRPVRLRPLW